MFIATSNKVDPPKSPFTFEEKRAMMALTGVDPASCCLVKNPTATEITDNYDPQNTVALFAVSDKDMAEDPRFIFNFAKMANRYYLKPIKNDMQGFDKHAYIVTVPTLNFDVLGKPLRKVLLSSLLNLQDSDSNKQRDMITDLFGRS